MVVHPRPLWALLVCFRKAFDLVNHNLLLRKLLNKNVPHCLIKRFFSYFDHRSQRVRIGTDYSGWLHLNGAMPHGSWLGPLSFLVLIDDLDVDCPIHKYVDDTTLTESLCVQHQSSIRSFSSTSSRSGKTPNSSDMEVNLNKAKELVLWPLSKTLL